MPTLIAKNALRYASRELVAGERFEASESDAFVLVSVGKADRAEGGAAGELSLRSESSSSEQPRRRYNRRDMRAQD